MRSPKSVWSSSRSMVVPVFSCPTFDAPKMRSRRPCAGCAFGRPGGDRRREGHRLGGKAARCGLGPRPEGGRVPGAGGQAAHPHRRPWGRQNHDHPRHPGHPQGQGGRGLAGCPDGPCSQASFGEYRDRGQDHSSPAGVRPQGGRLPSWRGPRAGVRSPRPRRGIDDRCAADGQRPSGPAPAPRRCSSSATSTSCPPWDQARCWPT